MAASTGAETSSSEMTLSKSTKPIKAILFDMDGTLLDTERLSDKALLMALFGHRTEGPDDDLSCLPQSLQKPPTSEWTLPWEVKRQILGLRGKEWAPICLDFARQHCDDLPTVEELIDRWEKSLSGMCSEVEECAGAKTLIRNIIACSGSKVPLAIATSSRMSGVEKKRTRHESHMFEHIDTIVTGDDPAVQNGKPAPDIYLEAARRLGVDPAECLVFEDALSGVKSGKAAGCQVVVVPDARFTDEERTKLFVDEGGADVVLTSLWEFDGRPFGMDFDMKEISRN